MASSHIFLAPCALSDAPSIGVLITTSFWPDPMYSLPLHRSTLPGIAALSARRTPRALLHDSQHRRHEKALDPTTGELLGYARWTLPPVSNVDSWWAKAKGPRASPEQIEHAQKAFDEAHWPKDEAIVVVPDPIDDAIERLGYQDKWTLDMVVVADTARGRGIGKLLIKSGLRQAQTYDCDVWLLAKKLSLDYYPQFGFELVEQVKRDDTVYGPGNYVVWFLVKTNQSHSAV